MGSKKYCGILPYFGIALYLYQRILMGLNISLAIWQPCINAILIVYRTGSSVKLLWMINYCSHQIRYLIEFERHMECIKKNRLKTSSKKCQLFKKELQYMAILSLQKERKSVQNL